MFVLIYRSLANKNFTSNDIENMLTKARVFNNSMDITGCLLFHHGSFLQLIEGKEQDVRALYEVIEKDGRHHKIELLCTEKVPVRLFKDWSMLYSNLENASERVDEKRHLFNEIYLDGGVVSSPGRSKFVLWRQINKILSYPA